MNSQTRPPSAGYRSPFSNADQQEGSWSQDSYFNTQPLDFYSHSSTQGSPQPLEDSTVPTSDYSAEPIFTDSAQVHPRFELIPHPVQGMVAVVKYDGTVVGVYGPPLYHAGPNDPEFLIPWQADSRVIVPQTPYTCGNTQKEWKPKSNILFFARGRLGVNLLDAYHGRFEGIEDRDSSPFDPGCRGITVRMHFLGYTSSTEVEKRLKQRATRHRETKARSMQLATKDYKDPPNPVIKSKLVQEVSKRIQWHISDLEANSDLFPFDDLVGQQWRLGHGKMKFEHMVITGLVNVSSGSWSPIICVE